MRRRSSARPAGRGATPRSPRWEARWSDFSSRSRSPRSSSPATWLALPRSSAWPPRENAEARIVALRQTEVAEAHKLRADANFAKARAAVDDYLTKVGDSQLLRVPGMQPLRRQLLESALEFYEGFLQERGDDPAVHAGLADAQLRVAMIHQVMGQDDEARRAFNSALGLYQALRNARRSSRPIRGIRNSGNRWPRPAWPWLGSASRLAKTSALGLTWRPLPQSRRTIPRRPNR